MAEQRIIELEKNMTQLEKGIELIRMIITKQKSNSLEVIIPTMLTHISPEEIIEKNKQHFAHYAGSATDIYQNNKKNPEFIKLFNTFV